MFNVKNDESHGPLIGNAVTCACDIFRIISAGSRTFCLNIQRVAGPRAELLRVSRRRGANLEPQQTMKTELWSRRGGVWGPGTVSAKTNKNINFNHN